jgi:hypothetical protein
MLAQISFARYQIFYYFDEKLITKALIKSDEQI